MRLSILCALLLASMASAIGVAHLRRSSSDDLDGVLAAKDVDGDLEKKKADLRDAVAASRVVIGCGKTETGKFKVTEEECCGLRSENGYNEIDPKTSEPRGLRPCKYVVIKDKDGNERAKCANMRKYLGGKYVSIADQRESILRESSITYENKNVRSDDIGMGESATTTCISTTEIIPTTVVKNVIGCGRPGKGEVKVTEEECCGLRADIGYMAIDPRTSKARGFQPCKWVMIKEVGEQGQAGWEHGKCAPMPAYRGNKKVVDEGKTLIALEQYPYPQNVGDVHKNEGVTIGYDLAMGASATTKCFSTPAE